VGRGVAHRHLSDYIAASALVHCFDGWAYLGKALHALMTGDHDCARHLGYYAELRGAMGILASDGIGVFDKEHIVVAARCRCLKMPPNRRPAHPNHPVGPGTHKFVWDAIEEMLKSPNSARLVLDAVSAGGNLLSDWLNHFGVRTALAGRLAADWLLDWGLDISRLADDQKARNLSSYRPTSFTTPRSPPVTVTLPFVSRVWLACEPTNENPFASLDRLLLRATIQKAFTTVSGRTAKHAKKQFRLRVEALLARLAPTALGKTSWLEFMCETTPDPLGILILSAGKAGPENRLHSLQVISRALLILRIASGASQRLVRSLPAGTVTHLDFWISAIGEDRALWPKAARPPALLDLWSDAGAAIDDITTHFAAVDSLSTLWSRFPLSAGVLSSCERVALWGFGL